MELLLIFTFNLSSLSYALSSPAGECNLGATHSNQTPALQLSFFQTARSRKASRDHISLTNSISAESSISISRSANFIREFSLIHKNASSTSLRITCYKTLTQYQLAVFQSDQRYLIGRTLTRSIDAIEYERHDTL